MFRSCRGFCQLFFHCRYSRSDCSGVRTRTVTLVESDWPMVSVTVSWNLYTPEVRLDTMIWSSKLVFYKAWKDSVFLSARNVTSWFTIK